MNFQKIIRLDEAITEIELAQERAFTVNANLSQNYFGWAEPKTLDLQVYYNDARIENDIVRDYLNNIEEGLHEIRRCLEDMEEDYKDGEREGSRMTQIIKVDNLKPCPFCGGEAELRTQENAFEHMTARVTCKRCHCTSVISMEGHTVGFVGKPARYVSLDECIEEVIARWNLREGVTA